MSEHDVAETTDRVLRRELCAWYRRHRRDLPWRRTGEPYRVWISEAMLQQTRVDTVIPYYERFVARFPTAHDLARADEDEVLALWSGLGYYRRARALHAAARALVEHHGGCFPDERAAALALPGVGPYTAGAVLSIAHGRAEPLVDGNVTRVLARLFALGEPRGSTALARGVEALAARLVPPAAPPGTPDGPGEWNQALMELGALVCTPAAPRCLACPLSAACAAFRAGRQEELPRPPERRPPVPVRLEILVARRGERMLLVRRPDAGRMAGMWEFPTRERAAAGASALLWPSAPAGAGAGVRLLRGELLGELTHGITHHRIRAGVHAAELSGRPRARRSHWRWVGADELDALPLTGMTRKVLRRFVAAD